MIAKKLTRDMLLGKKCRVIHRLSNGAGHGVDFGAICSIVDVVRGKGIVIRTETCPHCGQFAEISRVPREWLELIGEEELSDG